MRTPKNKQKPEDFAKVMDEYATFLLGGEDLSPELKKELEAYDKKRAEKHHREDAAEAVRRDRQQRSKCKKPTDG